MAIYHKTYLDSVSCVEYWPDLDLSNTLLDSSSLLLSCSLSIADDESKLSSSGSLYSSSSKDKTETRVGPGISVNYCQMVVINKLNEPRDTFQRMILHHKVSWISLLKCFKNSVMRNHTVSCWELHRKSLKLYRINITENSVQLEGVNRTRLVTVIQYVIQGLNFL